MPTKLRRTDVVVIGLGWSGAILANELTDEGLDVVALERGPWRDTARDLSSNFVPAELRYGIRLDLVLRPAQQTFTVRNKAGESALAVRAVGSLLPHDAWWTDSVYTASRSLP